MDFQTRRLKRVNIFTKKIQVTLKYICNKETFTDDYCNFTALVYSLKSK